MTTQLKPAPLLPPPLPPLPVASANVVPVSVGETSPAASASVGKKSDGKKALEAKWGKPNIAAGWTCIPNILVRRQRTLGLDSIDINILLHLMTYWWEDGNLPHPSKETLAQAIGISASTVQRRIRLMEAGGLLVRVERRKEKNRSDTNLYDLTPLKAILEPHAEHEMAERTASHAGRRTRMTKVAKVPASDASK